MGTPGEHIHLLTGEYVAGQWAPDERYRCGITVNPYRYFQTRDRALATCPGCKESPPLEERERAA